MGRRHERDVSHWTSQQGSIDTWIRAIQPNSTISLRKVRVQVLSRRKMAPSTPPTSSAKIDTFYDIFVLVQLIALILSMVGAAAAAIAFLLTNRTKISSVTSSSYIVVFLAQLFWLLAQHVGRNSSFCAAAAGLAHYFLLAACFFSAVASYNYYTYVRFFCTTFASSYMRSEHSLLLNFRLCDALHHRH
jgi:hypothetical protein